MAAFQTDLEQHNNTINGLQSKLGSYAPGSPEHQQTQEQLAQAIEGRTQFLHPAKNPGAIEHLGKHIAQRLHLVHPDLPQAVRISEQPIEGSKPSAATTLPGMTPDSAPMSTPALPAATHAVLAPTPGQLKARAEANMMAAAAPEAGNAFADYKRDLMATGMSEDDANQAIQIKAGTAAKEVAPKDHPTWKLYDLPGGDGAVWADPKTPPEGAQPHVNKGKQSADERRVAAYAGSLNKDPKDMTWDDYKTMAADQKQNIAGVKRNDRQAVITYKDGHTEIHDLSSTSSTSFPGTAKPGAAPAPTPGLRRRDGSAPAAAAPSTATPGALRGRARANAAGVTKPTGVTRVAGTKGNGQPAWMAGAGKQTPQAATALKAVDTAEAAYRDVKMASADPTPVGDQGVILAWLRGRVNRVTATEIAAVSNLGGAKMKLESGIVKVVSGKLTDQQRTWFLKSAKDNYENATQTAAKYGAPGGKVQAVDAAASKGKRSLKAAMGLEINKGKSDAEVTQHMKDLGYEVLP